MRTCTIYESADGSSRHDTRGVSRHRLLSVTVDSGSEPVIAAGRTLRRLVNQEDVAPIRLAASATGVRVEVATPADVDAARVLETALSAGTVWRMDASDTASSSDEYTVLLTSPEGTLGLCIPHELEIASTADRPMYGRPTLQPGSLTYETARLSDAMAHSLAKAAAAAVVSEASAASGDGDGGPLGPHQGGGPLAALDRVLARIARRSEHDESAEAAAAEALLPFRADLRHDTTLTWP